MGTDTIDNTGIQAGAPDDRPRRDEDEEVVIIEEADDEDEESIDMGGKSKTQSVSNIRTWMRRMALVSLVALTGGGAVAVKKYDTAKWEAHNQKMKEAEIMPFISTIDGTLDIIRDDLDGRNHPRNFKDDVAILKALKRDKDSIVVRMRDPLVQKSLSSNQGLNLLFKNVERRVQREIEVTENRMQEQQRGNVAAR